MLVPKPEALKAARKTMLDHISRQPEDGDTFDLMEAYEIVERALHANKAKIERLERWVSDLQEGNQ